jgi:peptide/nickel transport system substrate-binding protein
MRRLQSKKPYAILLMAVLALSSSLLAACGSSPQAASTSSSTGAASPVSVLTIGMFEDWTTMNPLEDNRPFPLEIDSFAYDSLTSYSRTETSPTQIPYLATSWTDSSTQVTFHLRAGVTCGDGHVLTPSDVLASFQEYLKLPKTNEQLSQFFGPGPYAVSANDQADTFTFQTKTPYRLLLQAVGSVPIVCPAGLKAFAANPTALDAATYGTGAYKVVSSQHNLQVVLDKRAGWHWGPPGSTPDADLPGTIILKVVPNTTTAANLLLTGGLDIDEVSGTDAARLAGSNQMVYVRSKGFAATNITFNLRSTSVFSNQALREAVMAAVDPESFLQAGYQGRGDVNLVQESDVNECYTPALGKLRQAASLSRAEAILKAGGFTLTNGKLMKDGTQVAVTALTSQDVGSMPDLLQSVLSQLGFKVTLNEVGGSAYGTDFLEADFDISIERGGDFPYDGYIGPFDGPAPPNGANLFGYNNPQLQAVAAKAETVVGSAACQYYNQVVSTEMSDAYTVPLVDPWSEWFASKNVVSSFVAAGPSTIPYYFITFK